MVLEHHKRYFDSIFQIPGFWDSPFLMFGFQEMYGVPDFKTFLDRKGVKEVTVLDYSDERADIYHDMNHPYPEIKNSYKVVCDIGCLEHVFNTYQCMKNLMDAVIVGGLYIIHTPVAGYINHGFHTFNAKMLRWVLEHNGFSIEYAELSSKGGALMAEPKRDCLLWMVGRKIQPVEDFVFPIQERGNVIHKSFM